MRLITVKFQKIKNNLYVKIPKIIKEALFLKENEEQMVFEGKCNGNEGTDEQVLFGESKLYTNEGACSISENL